MLISILNHRRLELLNHSQTEFVLLPMVQRNLTFLLKIFFLAVDSGVVWAVMVDIWEVPGTFSKNMAVCLVDNTTQKKAVNHIRSKPANITQLENWNRVLVIRQHHVARNHAEMVSYSSFNNMYQILNDVYTLHEDISLCMIWN